MFKQVRSGWPKAIWSIRNSVNLGRTKIMWKMIHLASAVNLKGLWSQFTTIESHSRQFSICYDSRVVNYNLKRSFGWLQDSNSPRWVTRPVCIIYGSVFIANVDLKSGRLCNLDHLCCKLERKKLYGIGPRTQARCKWERFCRQDEIVFLPLNKRARRWN